jgi:hypothetical protein
MYFEKFPKIVYSLDDGDGAFPVTDIFRRVKAETQRLLTVAAYDPYDIKDGETPEILAHKFYNNSNFHWIILIANDIIDPRWDWPLTQAQLKLFITDKYGVGNENAIKYYVTADAAELVVHSSYAGSKLPVTNTVYEEQQNDAKRRIKILKTQFLPNFINDFYEVLVDGN